MELKIKKKDFLEGLSRTQSVVEKKNTMPILANVLLEATGSELKISATDLEVALSYTVPAQVLKPGKITVLARSLQDIVKESGHEELRLTLGDNDRIELKSGQASFKIPGLNASEFPQFPESEGAVVEIPCSFFAGLINKTSFSMSTDETRYHLNGVLFQNDDKGIRMVATDGHRLALVDRTERDEAMKKLGTVSVIIPRKGVGELKRICSLEGNFELSIGTKGLLAKKGAERLFVRFLDGEFPQYRAVVPTDNDVTAKISKPLLVGALRRVSLLSNEKSRGVILNFSPGHLEMSAKNPDLGEANEDIEADYKGKKMGIGFNAKYLLDVLDVVGDEGIVFELKNETSAAILKSNKDDGFLCVVMPMRI